MRTAVLALLTLSFVGCRDDQLVSGINDSTFVRTVAELRRVPTLAGGDSVRARVLRDSILRAQGVTPGQLEQAARRLADAPNRAQRLWQEIDRRATAPTQHVQPQTAKPMLPAVTRPVQAK
jgi:hypothetical protein